jgi:hypothetical protein
VKTLLRIGSFDELCHLLNLEWRTYLEHTQCDLNMTHVVLIRSLVIYHSNIGFQLRRMSAQGPHILMRFEVFFFFYLSCPKW